MKKYSMTSFRAFSCLLGLLVFSQGVQAQKKKKKEQVDTLATLREFVSVSAGYKQVPMYLDLQMKTTTNLIARPEDTATVDAEFFIGRENSYVRFGEFEQIVNDSVALLVNNSAQAMILYPGSAELIGQIKAMMGSVMPDSSLRRLSEKYTATNLPGEKNYSVIELTSRVKIKDELAKEWVRIEYDAPTGTPLQVITIKRTMLPLEPVQYDVYRKDAKLAEHLWSDNGNYFFIKEQTVVLVYRHLAKDDLRKAPVTVKDRLEQTVEGEYRPVASYAGYNLHKMAGK